MNIQKQKECWKPTNQFPFTPSENQKEPIGDRRRVTWWGPIKGHYGYNNKRVGEMLCALDVSIVGDKKCKNSEGRLGRTERFRVEGCRVRA
jgi:hypothetical protein